MSRNGFWWEKSQKSLSGSREGWDEREEGSKCLAQSKQPKKNKGREKWKAMTSVFFLVNFLHFLSTQESKNGKLLAGNGCKERSLCEISVAVPGDVPYSQPGPIGQCQGLCDTEGESGDGLTQGRVEHQAESPLPSAAPAPRHCQQHGVASVPLSPGEGWLAQRWLCLSSVNCQSDPGN